MNNETHEDRVKILEEWKKYPTANAVDGGGDFWYIPDVGKNICLSESRYTHYGLQYVTDLRSLSDIQQLVDMQNEIDKWHKAYLTAMNEFDKKCKSLNEISSRCRDEESYNSYLVDELESYGNPENWTQSYDCHGKLISQHALFLPRLK